MTVAQAPCGTIQGLATPTGLEFRGIPYAQPPLQTRRFRTPEPHPKFAQPYRADRFDAASLQEPNELLGIKEISEDCLRLHIWTPACDTKRRPVMVWIHGGAFMSGSGAQKIYHGGALSQHGDVVVVNINYRLGALGFLYLNALLPEQDICANVGLQDQILALRWVQENIVAFGGDPDNVTVFGESAGAMSIAALLAMPAADDLFQRAILQSGGADQALQPEVATAVSKLFLEAAEIDPARPHALWELSTKTILQAQRQCLQTAVNRGYLPQPNWQRGMTLLPVIDGDSLAQLPLRAIQNGASQYRPLLIGCTRDEWNFFLKVPGASAMQSATPTPLENRPALIKRLESILPGQGERAVTWYERQFRAARSNASWEQIYSAFESDRYFRIPGLRLLQAQATAPRWSFQFDWDEGLFGACHASDIPFVFGNTNDVGQFLTGGGDAASMLSTIVQNCWIAFARSGDPATDATGAWPAFSAERPATLHFDKHCHLSETTFDATEPFWDGIL